MKIGLEHRGTIPTSDVKLHLSIPKELNLIEVQPFGIQKYPIGNELIVVKGEVYKGTKTSISLSFEPSVCGKMKLHGYVSYAGSEGEIRVEKMNPIDFDVTCPSFKPDLKPQKSIEDVKTFFFQNFKQWRYYPIPKISIQECESKLDEIIRNLNFIRLEAETLKQRPIKNLIWYFGVTQVTNREYVVMIEISEADQFIKIEVAGTEKTYLIGVLTKISDGFSNVLEIEQIISERKEFQLLRRSFEKLMLIF